MNDLMDWMGRLAGEMLFQGGYVASPTVLLVDRPAPATDGTRRDPGVCGDSRGPLHVAPVPRHSGTLAR